MLVSDSKGTEWLAKADWKNPLEDFAKHVKLIEKSCEIANCLHNPIPEIFPKTVDWATIQQGKKQPVETVLDSFERFEKTFKQYLRMGPASLRSHQNDSSQVNILKWAR